MWILTYDTNELTYETEPDSQRTESWLPRRSGVGERWSGGLEIADAKYHV